MSGFLIRLLFPLLAMMLPAAAARAAEVVSPDLADPVQGMASLSYLDLARHVLPDLELRNGAYRGSEAIEMRHVGGADYAVVPQEEFTVGGVDALPVRADDRDRLALILDLGDSLHAAEGFVVLALYEPGNPPVLLDAVQIGFDRRTHFHDPAALALGTDSDLLVTVSTHSNSSQGYATSAMILARDGRLKLVDTIFTLDDRGCGFERVQMPEFNADAGSGPAYADIAVAITETTTHTGENCGEQKLPPEGTRTIRATYRWDDAEVRFMPDSDALEVLARETEARF